MSEELRQLVIDCVRSTAAEQDLPLPEQLTDQTVLFGDGGMLDSMALVSLVVAVEEAVADGMGRTVALADEKALSQKRSPYRTIGSLIEYAARQIDSPAA